MRRRRPHRLTAVTLVLGLGAAVVTTVLAESESAAAPGENTTPAPNPVWPSSAASTC